MSLDLKKLENVERSGKKIIAGCPACIAQGADGTKDHLVYWPDTGKFGCVAHQDDAAHRKLIFRLAGIRGEWTGPIPVKVRRPACATRQPKTLMVLDWLSAPGTETSLARHGGADQKAPAQQWGEQSDAASRTELKDPVATDGPRAAAPVAAASPAKVPKRNPFVRDVPSLLPDL
jgi:hypothetical protein